MINELAATGNYRIDNRSARSAPGDAKSSTALNQVTTRVGEHAKTQNAISMRFSRHKRLKTLIKSA
jgi:hypothetical protein